jgi:hypothetical protein
MQRSKCIHWGLVLRSYWRQCGVAVVTRQRGAVIKLWWAAPTAAGAAHPRSHVGSAGFGICGQNVLKHTPWLQDWHAAHKGKEGVKFGGGFSQKRTQWQSAVNVPCRGADERVRVPCLANAPPHRTALRSSSSSAAGQRAGPRLAKSSHKNTNCMSSFSKYGSARRAQYRLSRRSAQRVLCARSERHPTQHTTNDKSRIVCTPGHHSSSSMPATSSQSAHTHAHAPLLCALRQPPMPPAPHRSTQHTAHSRSIDHSPTLGPCAFIADVHIPGQTIENLTPTPSDQTPHSARATAGRGGPQRPSPDQRRHAVKASIHRQTRPPSCIGIKYCAASVLGRQYMQPTHPPINWCFCARHAGAAPAAQRRRSSRANHAGRPPAAVQPAPAHLPGAHAPHAPRLRGGGSCPSEACWGSEPPGQRGGGSSA